MCEVVLLLKARSVPMANVIKDHEIGQKMEIWKPREVTCILKYSEILSKYGWAALRLDGVQHLTYTSKKYVIKTSYNTLGSFEVGRRSAQLNILVALPCAVTVICHSSPLQSARDLYHRNYSIL